MTKDDIIKWAREAGFTAFRAAGLLPSAPMDISAANVVVTAELTRFAELATQAERESRLSAQAENADLKERLARSGVEMRAAVRAERKECAKAIRSVDALHAAGLVDVVLDAIRARSHSVDANKMVPGIALDSGEFIPADEISYHPV